MEAPAGPDLHGRKPPLPRHADDCLRMKPEPCRDLDRRQQLLVMLRAFQMWPDAFRERRESIVIERAQKGGTEVRGTHARHRLDRPP